MTDESIPGSASPPLRSLWRNAFIRLLWGIGGAATGGGFGFMAVVAWFSAQPWLTGVPGPVGGDPIGRWAEGMVQLIAALFAAAIGAAIGAVVVLGFHRSRSKKSQRPCHS